MADHGRQSGFTLLELMVTIGIAGVLMAIAVPSYRYVTTSNRISTEVNSLLGDMQFARSEAIKEGQMVTVCPTTDGASCSGANKWATGWIVFQDFNQDQAVDDPRDSILRFRPSFATTNSSDTLTIAAVTSVSFNREGFAPTLLSVQKVNTAIFKFQDSSAKASFTRCLELSSTGLLTTVLSGQSGC